MKEYELKVFGDGKPAVILSVRLGSDFAAVRRAVSLCQDGQGIEVWRGMDCIFARPPSLPSGTYR